MDAVAHGGLRLPNKPKERFKAVAREKGVPVAITEIKKRFGKA